MSKEQEMYFFIADISGYTTYMVTNSDEAEHAKIIITQLIETIVDNIKLPMEIEKLEGDAIFLTLPRSSENCQWINQKIFTFFDLFERKVNELKLANFCACKACQNLDTLKLKVIGHYGTASLQKIGRFRELSGVDVIILHRLLKNHVPSHRYFLVTEAAFRQLLIPGNLKVTKMEESYEGVGTIPIYVIDPPYVDPGELPRAATYWEKMKYWYNLHFGKTRKVLYHNLPESKKD